MSKTRYNLTWVRDYALDKKPTYIVAQVCKSYEMLVFDVDDAVNDESRRAAPLIMELRTKELLNPLNRIKVKLYQIGKLHDTSKEVPYFGSASTSSCTHQGTLRPSTQAKDFEVIKRGR